MNITLEQFKCIIRNLRVIDKKFMAFKPEEEAQFYINLLEPALSILIEAYYGDSNSTKIWNFVVGKSEFNTIEELYEFVSDNYSKMVTFDSALTIDQLLKLFPNEEMFKLFNNIINNKC